MKNGTDESNFFYILKGFAIISVIIAHTAVLNSNYIKFDDSILALFGSFGLLGVPCFFLAAGYFYYNFNKSFKGLILNKLNSIILPWIFCGTIVYLISSFFGSKGNSISVHSYIMFIIGNGSLFYFLPDLLFFYILFYFIKPKIGILIVPLFIINIASILTLNSFLNPYLNPLNFISFFAAGLILRKRNMLDYVNGLRKYIVPIVIIFLLVLIYISYFENTDSGGFAYFKISSLVFEILGFISISIAA